MRILVATDLTARSDQALVRAAMLAQQLKAEVAALHVVDAGQPDDLAIHAADWARRALAREAEELRRRFGVKLATEVRIGRPEAEILAAADPDAVDLLVIGVHPGPAGDAREFAQTTAGRILKSSVTGMLLVRNEARAPYNRVLVGVDYSMFSRAAIRQALEIAPDAELSLVHACHVPFKGFLSSAGSAREIAGQHRRELDAALEEEMALLRERADALGADPKRLAPVIREGTPQRVLREVCEADKGDLVVIGTHSRGTVSRAVWGSVATDLLNDPPADLLVIKPF